MDRAAPVAGGQVFGRLVLHFDAQHLPPAIAVDGGGPEPGPDHGAIAVLGIDIADDGIAPGAVALDLQFFPGTKHSGQRGLQQRPEGGQQLFAQVVVPGSRGSLPCKGLCALPGNGLCWLIEWLGRRSATGVLPSGSRLAFDQHPPSPQGSDGQPDQQGDGGPTVDQGRTCLQQALQQQLAHRHCQNAHGSGTQRQPQG